MGVTGLWRLIDASGKPVPLETLEGKVLAIDVSIWIHQVLQGYQDKRGNAVPNAHLLGLFHRICKVLYFKIKPVFVFDGGVPLLKKNTIAIRKKHKAIAADKAEKMKNDLLANLMKHSLVKGVLSKKVPEEEPDSSSASKTQKSINDMFKLPVLPQPPGSSDESDSDTISLSPRKQTKWKGNIHSVDVTSPEFKSLPADVRYDILTDLKETRKQNSWGKLHEIPEESNQFSSYQMKRLLKRRKVQESLEAAEQEMGGKNLTLDELEKLMTEQGVDTNGRDTAYRIASDDKTRMIYIKDLKSMAAKDDSKIITDISEPGCSKDSNNDEELTVVPEESVVNNIDEYDLENDWDSDIEFIEETISSPVTRKYFGKAPKNPALSYMLENTELTQKQILALIEQSKVNLRNAKAEEKSKRKRVDAVDILKDKKKIGRDLFKDELASIKEELLSPDELSDENFDGESKENSITQEINPQLSEDSESDDFVEVEEIKLPSKVQNKMEIIITTDDNIEDDMFADVFVDKQEINISSDLSSQELLNCSRISEKSAEGKDDSPNISVSSERSPEPAEDIKEISTELGLSSQDEENNDIPEESAKVHVSLEECPELSKPISNSQAEEANSLKNPPDAAGKSQNVDVPIENATELITNDSENSAVPEKSASRVDSIINRLECEKPELLSKIKNPEELLDMKSQLETENEELKESIGKLERQSTEVTEQMRSDAQELLKLFGIPYVIAPQEAEAQCAYLELINLTDGTITDDSDIWLFGGRCVYKNFFNNSKRVMQYLSKDIEHHFKLTRQQMIQLALLVGSDYTLGVQGIGPVTALEILAGFPTNGDDLLRGLSNFSSWLSAGRIAGPGRAALRNKLKNVNVDRGFPSQAVVQAYLFPTVDESRETFTWGKPNLVLLADYTRDKFGWTRNKFEEIMGPVVKRLEAKSQRDIMSYFKTKSVPKSIEDTLSKRVQKAVERMGKNPEEFTDEEDVQEDGKAARKRGKGKISGGQETVGTETEKIEEDGVKRRKKGKEVIPQREKDRQNALNKKLKAIEVFRKSTKGPGKSRKRATRLTRNAVQKEAQLSESSSDSN